MRGASALLDARVCGRRALHASIASAGCWCPMNARHWCHHFAAPPAAIPGCALGGIWPKSWASICAACLTASSCWSARRGLLRRPVESPASSVRRVEARDTARCSAARRLAFASIMLQKRDAPELLRQSAPRECPAALSMGIGARQDPRGDRLGACSALGLALPFIRPIRPIPPMIPFMARRLLKYPCRGVVLVLRPRPRPRKKELNEDEGRGRGRGGDSAHRYFNRLLGRTTRLWGWRHSRIVTLSWLICRNSIQSMKSSAKCAPEKWSS